MGTFTLHADFNEVDGTETATKHVQIQMNTQVTGSGGVIWDPASVPLVNGVLNVTLPATDNAPGTFGYVVSRGNGMTRRWNVPAQAPGATVELTTFTAKTPLPSPSGLVEVPEGLETTGTPDATTFLRGDGAWAVPVGGGGGGAVSSVAGRTGAVVLTSTDVGLGNVTNTSDANKPVSTAQAAADAVAQAAAIAAAATDATTKANAAQSAAVQRANHTGTQSADTLTDGTTNKAFLATERTKLTGIATGATANSTDATLLARANHTGTQSADTLTDGTTNKAFLATERTKLTGVATGATANSTDATLLARANHTGTQAVGTITGLGTAATVNTGTTSGTIPLLSTGGVLPIARLATGTPDGTKFVRDDGTLVTPSGGSSPGFAVVAGNYFPTPLASNGSVAPTLDEMRAAPIVVSATTTFDRIACVVGTPAGTALARLGIYADNGRGQPGTLVLDAGTVSLASAGVRAITISQTLNPGVYHLVSVHQTANAGVQNFVWNPFKYIVSTNNPDNYSFSVGECWSQSSVSGALPGTFTVGGAPGTGSSVAVYLRGA